MTKEELKSSWARTIRYLAASRYYLPVNLSSPEASECWAKAEEFIHHNELGLALEYLIDLGEISSAPVEFWSELLLAAEEMQLKEYAESIRKRL